MLQKLQKLQSKSDLQKCKELFKLFPELLADDCDIDYISDYKVDALYKYNDIVLHQGNIVFRLKTNDSEALAAFGSGSDMEDEYNFYYVFLENDKYYLIHGISSEYGNTYLYLRTRENTTELK